MHTTPHHTKTELNFVQILFANTRQVKDGKCIQPPRNAGAQSFSPLREPWISLQGWRKPLFCTQVLFWGAGWCHYQILLRLVASAEPLRVAFAGVTGIGLLQTSSSQSMYPSTCACANACPNFLLLLFRLRLLALLGLSASTSLLPFNSGWASVNTFCCLHLALRAFFVFWTPCTRQQIRRYMLLYPLLQPLCGPGGLILWRKAPEISFKVGGFLLLFSPSVGSSRGGRS